MNKRIRKFFAVCLSFAIAIVPLSIRAQIGEDKERIATNLVLINVLVTDRSGTPVGGLLADQFELFVDNFRQPIDSFSMGPAPISLGIVFDLHPTTADRTRAVVESLRRFKQELGPEDDIFLVAFDMRGQQAFDFVPTLEQLERHMSEPERPRSRSLYDAVYYASEKIRSGRSQKRVLVIISDSADHNSRHSFVELQRKLATINAEVYAVITDENHGFGFKDLTHRGKERYPFSEVSELDRAALLDLTLKTGGGTYWDNSKNAFQLHRIYNEIAAELRSHYTLGFYPDLIDRESHNIRVRLRGATNREGFVLAYRRTYGHPGLVGK